MSYFRNFRQRYFFYYESKRKVSPCYKIKLIVGISRPIQLRRLLRDVVSLGVAEIHLTGTELGEKSYLKSNLLEKVQLMQR